ncbi:hypothetical protein M405DRAFT_867188 [Rhizopogon salebrosus TDB-379]|nr:hypothetical protein M405DRAFT_867188 [Rhizopogon salebrosus TDB-379]
MKSVGAVAIYDDCLTIAPEVRLIWGRRWNVIRVTFTLTRHLTFIGAAMTTYAAVADRFKFKSCSTFNNGSKALHMTSIIAAEGLLIFRTFAFWQQSKKVLIWLLILAAVVASVANIFVGLFALEAMSYITITDTPQFVMHGVLASRILFNLRQSHETDSKTIDRIFPLAHASQASLRCNDNSRLHSRSWQGQRPM